MIEMFIVFCFHSVKSIIVYLFCLRKLSLLALDKLVDDHGRCKHLLICFTEPHKHNIHIVIGINTSKCINLRAINKLCKRITDQKIHRHCSVFVRIPENAVRLFFQTLIGCFVDTASKGKDMKFFKPSDCSLFAFQQITVISGVRIFPLLFILIALNHFDFIIKCIFDAIHNPAANR